MAYLVPPIYSVARTTRRYLPCSRPLNKYCSRLPFPPRHSSSSPTFLIGAGPLKHQDTTRPHLKDFPQKGKQLPYF